MIYSVILSGGTGTRLWPLSCAAVPKQLLPLASEFCKHPLSTVIDSLMFDDSPSMLVRCGASQRYCYPLLVIVNHFEHMGGGWPRPPASELLSLE
jgi:hypothetical protein